MTTTEEKISDIEEQMDLISDALQTMGEQIARLKGLKEETKPPDPEPLECWGNLFTGHIDAYLTKHTAKKEAGYGEPVRTVIHLREVTPQDEEKEKDAARFRRLVEMAGVAWQPGDTEWCQAVPGNLLREEIDDAMESDER